MQKWLPNHCAVHDGVKRDSFARTTAKFKLVLIGEKDRKRWSVGA
jgi:hypothetical protein